MNTEESNSSFPVGTRVRVKANTLVDRYYFDDLPTGTVTRSEDRYLGITVRFDVSRHYQLIDGKLEKHTHNFHPINLERIDAN